MNYRVYLHGGSWGDTDIAWLGGDLEAQPHTREDAIKVALYEATLWPGRYEVIEDEMAVFVVISSHDDTGQLISTIDYRSQPVSPGAFSYPREAR